MVKNTPSGRIPASSAVARLQRAGARARYLMFNKASNVRKVQSFQPQLYCFRILPSRGQLWPGLRVCFLPSGGKGSFGDRGLQHCWVFDGMWVCSGGSVIPYKESMLYAFTGHWETVDHGNIGKDPYPLIRNRSCEATPSTISVDISGINETLHETGIP